MGFYINPENQTKERWLVNEAQFLSSAPPTFPESKDEVLVCLVDNGPFTAAGIAFDEDEMKAFIGPNNDERAKFWFVAPRDRIIDVCPEVEKVLA